MDASILRGPLAAHQVHNRLERCRGRRLSRELRGAAVRLERLLRGHDAHHLAQVSVHAKEPEAHGPRADEEAARAAVAASLEEGRAEERLAAKAEPSGVDDNLIDPLRTSGDQLTLAEEAARAAIAASLAEGRAEDGKRSQELASGAGAQMDGLVASEDLQIREAISPRVWKLMQEARSSKSTEVLMRAEEAARKSVAASLAKAREEKIETGSDLHGTPELLLTPARSPGRELVSDVKEGTDTMDSATEALRKAEKAARLRVSVLAAAEQAAIAKVQPAKDIAKQASDEKLLGSRLCTLREPAQGLHYNCHTYTRVQNRAS